MSSFTTAGCHAFTVPAGVSSVQVNAVGAAGGTVFAVAGGTGDGVSATLSGLSSGETLDVCVDFGGGAAGTSMGGSGGSGGGASGVAVGPDFSLPALIAGGGGGSGRACGGPGCGGLSGGAAGASGKPQSLCGSFSGQGCGGGGGTQSGFGAGGADGGDLAATPGADGAAFTATGPGAGGAGGHGFSDGAGGGGGGGYYGGGGGGGADASGGGGGGGSDLCNDGAVGSATVSSCSISSGAGTSTVAGGASGDAHVTLTYTPHSGVGGGTNPGSRPTISAFKLHPMSFKAVKGTTLTLVLSAAATVKAVIDRAGHKLHRRCTTTARTGKTCMIKLRSHRFTGVAGHNSFKLHTRGLKPGRYTLVLTATNSTGTSRVYKSTFKIKS
jgi:hypothetical protein